MALEAGGAYRLLAATHFGCQVPNLSRDYKFVKPVPGTLQEAVPRFKRRIGLLSSVRGRSSRRNRLTGRFPLFA